MAKPFHCTFCFLSGGQWYITMCISVHAWASPRAESCALHPGPSPRSQPEEMGMSKGGALPLEWSSLISWTNHPTLHLCLECRAGTLPIALLATETAGKGKTPTQQAQFVSMEKSRSLSRICPQPLKGTSAERWYYDNCQWVAVLLLPCLVYLMLKGLASKELFWTKTGEEISVTVSL